MDYSQAYRIEISKLNDILLRISEERNDLNIEIEKLSDRMSILRAEEVDRIAGTVLLRCGSFVSYEIDIFDPVNLGIVEELVGESSMYFDINPKERCYHLLEDQWLKVKFQD